MKEILKKSLDEQIKEKGYKVSNEVEPERIRLEIGEMVIGEYIGIDENHVFGPSVVLRNENNIITLPLTIMLKRKLNSIQSGTCISIVRDNDILSKKGRTVKNFRIYILEKRR